MNKQIITFDANEQSLIKTGGVDKYSSNKVSYIEAHFNLGENWSGYDSVRAVWSTWYECISTVLDTEGICIVPYEVLKRTEKVMVNLVGSISEDDVLTDRITTYPIKALEVDADAKVCGSNTQPITPSEYEQFVEAVKADADRAEDAKEDARGFASSAEISAQNASISETNASTSEDNAKASELNAETYKNQAQTYAQNANNSAISAGNAKDEAEDARDVILGMRAEATTLPEGSSATASYNDGVMSFGIPKGDKGDKGNTGETGAPAGFGTVSATVDSSVGTPSVEVTASGADTAKNFAFAFHNLKGQKGDKGDTGEVSQAEFDAAITDVKSDIKKNVDKMPMVVLTQLGVKVPFTAKNGDIIVAQSVSGENMTPTAVRFYNASGVETDYWTITGYGTLRKFTYNVAESSFVAIQGGTAQAIAVFNLSSDYFNDISAIDEAVDELNYFAITTELGFVNKKPFHIENTNTILIETVDRSDFTIQSIRLYDKTQTQLESYGLTGYGNHREITVAGLSAPAEYIDAAGGTAQNVKITNKSSRYAIEFNQLESRMNGTINIPVEIGSMSGGKPTTSNAYVRSRDFIKANAGDVLTISPKAFGLYYGCVYLYSTDDDSGYTSDFDIPTISANSTWKHTFTSGCYFKFRASNASGGANIKPSDLFDFNSVFVLSHLYNIDEAFSETGALALDYATLNTSISGKFNIAIQTDTHMSDYIGYSTSAYPKSDFGKLKTIANSINKLDVDVFANLGDFIRGYQFDPDFENRATIDKIISCYDEINTYKAYVIGNHDDGCMFYNNHDYNDNPLTSNVLFPTEQFNRITKYGINNKGKSNYYYEDVNGVRIITLYQRDFDYSQSVPQIEAFNIGATQLNWLTNTALDTNLPVIVLTHAPLVSTLYADSRGGFDSVLSALSAFVSDGGTIIAVLSGHTHEQGSATVDGINHIVFDDGYSWFELVSIDLVNRSITCKAINKTLADMTFTY